MAYRIVINSIEFQKKKKNDESDLNVKTLDEKLFEMSTVTLYVCIYIFTNDKLFSVNEILIIKHSDSIVIFHIINNLKHVILGV